MSGHDQPDEAGGAASHEVQLPALAVFTPATTFGDDGPASPSLMSMNKPTAVLLLVMSGCTDPVSLELHGSAEEPAPGTSVGALRWAKTFGNLGQDSAYRVAMVGDRVVVSGYAAPYGLIPHPDGPEDPNSVGFVSVLSAADGTTLWQTEFQLLGPETTYIIENFAYVEDVAVTPDGRIAFVGDFGRQVDFGTGLRRSTLCGSGFFGVWSADGSPELLRVAPQQFPMRITAAPDGSFYVSGREFMMDCEEFVYADPQPTPVFEGYLSHLDQNGNELWRLHLGVDSYPNGLAGYGDGGALIAGTYAAELHLGDTTIAGTTHGGGQSFVAALTPAGNPAWVRSFKAVDPAVDWIELMDIAFARGEIIAAGTFSGTVDVDGQLIHSNEHPVEGAYVDEPDALLIRVTDRGDVIDARSLGGNNLRAWSVASFPGQGIGIGAGGQLGSALGGLVIRASSDSITAVQNLTADDRAGTNVRDVAMAPTGDLVAVGEFTGLVDFGGGVIENDQTDTIHESNGFIAVFDPLTEVE